jgi:hypothetical protein
VYVLWIVVWPFVLFSFGQEQTTQWQKEEEQTTQWPKEEEQTTQWPKEKNRQHNGQKKIVNIIHHHLYVSDRILCNKMFINIFRKTF